MKIKFILTILLGFAGFCQSIWSAPQVLNYSGKISVSGQPYTGQAYFKFALVNRAGTVSYWTNGPDDVWFELVGDSNVSKTYAGSDFGKLLPMPSEVPRPQKLRILLKAKSNPTQSATALREVFWSTSDPKLHGKKKPSGSFATTTMPRF